MKKDIHHFYKLAAERKWWEENLKQLLFPIRTVERLASKPDGYFLEWMTRCIFNAGFYWSVINKKWPGFQEAFLEFDIDTLLSQDEDFWIALWNDKRIVRHKKKITAVRQNLNFLQDIRMEYGSFAAWISQWPETDQVWLQWHLKKNGSRLGGMTAQYFLRFIWKDSFITSPDMVLALKHAWADIADTITSKRDLTTIQNLLNSWHAEAGYSFTHLSKILAYSAGENNPNEVLDRESRRWEND